MDRKDLQTLARMRLRDAKVLVAAGQASGAYYLAGYAVECALKACIAKKTERYEFPDLRKVQRIYTHNLADLVGAAELGDALAKRMAGDASFANNWGITRTWNEQSRYQIYSESMAVELVEAIGNRRHGVLQWLALYW